MAPMPRQKPGRSIQDYRTPPEFLRAVKTLLEIDAFDADLAADEHNAVAECYFTARDSALEASTWKFGDGWNWLNPPYANIRPWVERAEIECVVNRVQTAMLIPAAVGANYWRDWVHRRAKVLFLNGRITFVGCTAGYPKDCALLLYAPREQFCIKHGDDAYEIWDWRTNAQA